ncbi:MAG TPA: PAS domain S-box protein, partial [Candidatus Deferrimicrobiaceae bacterium]|nr:PAS domain S-box protein [Candidatus Deferrimicrobiaceae bacterium]
MELLRGLLSPNDFMPHGYCYLWNARLVWLHVVSDSLIALAYFSIPITLVYFIRKRRDLPFNWMFVCFGVFILACGATHAMEVWTLWHANYWLSGGVKAITALVSVPTAVLLVGLIPRALALPSPEELRHEIAERRFTEEALHRAKMELESRVQERTEELRNTNRILVDQIVHRQESEEKLRRSEERFRLLVESVQDYAIFMLDPSGRVTSWNAGAEKINGYHADEIIGQHFSRFYSREDLDQRSPQKELETVAAKGRFEDEGWRIRKDGSRFWANVVVTALRDERGTLIGFSKITRDLSDRKHAEEELQKLASLIEHSSDFIGMASLEGDAQFVNPAGRALVGLDRDESVGGTKVLDYIFEEDRERFRQQVLPIVLQRGHWEGEVRFRHFQSGAAIPMLQKVFCIAEAGTGQPLTLATISRNITERKRAEEDLRLTQTELEHVSRVMTMGELTASIAHEINQPLAAIVNDANACARMLACQPPDVEEVRQAVADIAQAGTRAAEVIARVRSFLNKKTVTTDRVNINEVIQEVLSLVAGELEKNRISTRLDLLLHLSLVLGDRIQLQQVVLNLV